MEIRQKLFGEEGVGRGVCAWLTETKKNCETSERTKLKLKV